MKDTKISWTDSTFNPWWGCIKVSAGCDHCYAETFAKRTGNHVWGPAKTTSRRFFGDKHWGEPLKWNRDAGTEGVRRRVFCASMADVFEDNPSLNAERERLWGLIAFTKNLDWLLLTKRPENMRSMTPGSWQTGWPVNAWALTTAENQEMADKRIPELLKVPSAVHGLSVEPMLGPVNLIDYLSLNGKVFHRGGYTDSVNWVIVGGESGAGCRPMKFEWARNLVEDCQHTGCAVFVKQLGGHPDKRAVMADWPEELRIQQFPEASHG